MGKHLSDYDIERVVELLDGWQDKLTWDALCQACGPVLKTEPSRQTLYRYPRVKNAFQQTKERLKHVEEEIKLPPSMKVAAERIARLERENERLKRENFGLLEQFVVWQYNAYVHGLSESDLNKALPSIDRGNTT